jgi:hypothetical protein
LLRKKQLVLGTIITAGIFLFGCTKAPKENEVYTIKESTKEKDISKIDKKLNTEGIINFYDYEKLNVDGSKAAIPLTLSQDKKFIYYMAQTGIKLKSGEAELIKGNSLVNIDLIKRELSTGKENKIAEAIPFISSVKWNPGKKTAAFMGGGRITLYNEDIDSVSGVIEGERKDITSFGWSPDGKKIYLENESLPNGQIYYVDSKKLVEAYDIKESLYYKGQLDEKYYYGTQLKNTSDYYTVILDKGGSIVNSFNSQGRYRDSYKKAVLQIGSNSFGLDYYSDINELDRALVITKEYVYDAKFIYDGSFVYITKNEEPEKNNFYINLANTMGELVKRFEVSGSSIMLSPDGRTGYVGGRLFEQINFGDKTIGFKLEDIQQGERENIFKTIRGAIDVIYKYQLTLERDSESARKYFIDTHDPEQWAYTDVLNLFNDGLSLAPDVKDYNLVVNLRNLVVDKDRASANISILAKGSDGIGAGTNSSLELIKKEDRWYVTGLSTFPASRQHIEVKEKVETVVKQAQQGKLFDGQLKDKEIQIGQIQFWRLSEPHLADNIDYANYCKVYLKVKENGTEVIYKLVLDKKNQNYWKEVSLRKDRLSLLF